MARSLAPGAQAGASCNAMPLARPYRALLVVLYCCGCWGADDDDDDDNGGGKDAGSGAAVPTDFVFDNRGSEPVVLGSNCGGNWLALTQDGEPVGIDPSCACSCEAFDSTEGCAGCPDICQDTSELAVPGVPHTYSWDGVVLSYDARPECYRPQAPTHGSVLTAWACHDVDANAEPPCVSDDFEYGVELEVTLSATPAPHFGAPQPIAIENQTGVPIEIVVDHCGSQGWFRLAEVDARIATSAFCACACNDEFRPEVCPDCGACAEDQILTLANGESLTGIWDGRFVYQYDSGCSRGYAMPPTYAPLASVCYTKLGDDSPTCTPAGRLSRSFDLAFTFVVTE
jgi:hypothetical protein